MPTIVPQTVWSGGIDVGSSVHCEELVLVKILAPAIEQAGRTVVLLAFKQAVLMALQVAASLLYVQPMIPSTKTTV